ncbi:MAG: hypothetical protein P8Z49_12370 [Acidobacteriota bacterium]
MPEKQTDHISGSIDLLETAAGEIRKHLDSRGVAGLEPLLDVISAEHPSMALRLNLCHMLKETLPEGRAALLQTLDSFMRSVVDARVHVAATFAGMVEHYRWTVAATYSRSAQVRECLAAAVPAGLKRVVLSEARPSGEGIIMARELRGEGLEVTLTADAALPGFLVNVNVLVVGADAGLRDYFINKTGTAHLMREARLKGAGTVVVTVPQKTLSVGTALTWRNEPLPRPVRLPKTPKGVSWTGELYEKVPWDLVSFPLGRTL